jgi:hypothetical protein
MLRAASHAFLAGVLRLKGVQADARRERRYAICVYAEEMLTSGKQIEVAHAPTFHPIKNNNYSIRRKICTLKY